MTHDFDCDQSRVIKTHKGSSRVCGRRNQTECRFVCDTGIPLPVAGLDSPLALRNSAVLSLEFNVPVCRKSCLFFLVSIRLYFLNIDAEVP
jgi:hypothetical protein